ncbi:aminotransferase class V-fold PLP-dependent enzyme [Chengkuizengella axinellae]|uniref:Aminotransferase class V-fold PLP-dependent enzyme n=1 Tax=Chengkuizengella axinellae TaxID=3064388 RepID=A0ABT9J1M5_9BACL|nr:aminotransferase class V-fold PLP-dependent enzyme [Chengkuizengella sp. 2205SS18-9]MDP5275514.1 aminotransferase class V-fold PLP-dependent enzyme [Chengkuizengella sp. 2205SS18-9]
MSDSICFQRGSFPMLKHWNYLSSCSQSALHEDVLEAMNDYQKSLLVIGNNWDIAIEKLEKTRASFAKFIGAEVDEIAIVPSVSDAISRITMSLPIIKERNTLVFTDLDFPTVGQILQAQKEQGFRLEMIHSENGVIETDAYEKEVSENTLLTYIPHVCYYNGFKQDIKSISNIVHQKGSLLFVDAYQSAGHIPIHVKEMDIDICTTGMRKYMLGIAGIAFLYIKKDLMDQLKPKSLGWLGQDKHSMFNLTHPTLATSARRFEGGTPSFISIFAAHAALELFQKLDLQSISNYHEDLTQKILEYAIEHRLPISGSLNIKKRSSLTSFYVENAEKLGKLFKHRNINVTTKDQVIRMAPHFYNTYDEVVQMMDVLVKHNSDEWQRRC